MSEVACRRLAGTTALVTGGASGIGAASARRLAAEGALVVVADVRDESGEAVAAAVRSAGGEAHYAHCDVARDGDWERLRDAVRAHSDRLDILHANAYIDVPSAAAHDLDPSDWHRQLAVTLDAAYLAMRTFAAMLTDARASVIFTSSVHALFGMPGRPAYAAAKGGIEALARQLAVDYGPAVRVNTVVPGPILTRAWDGIGDRDRARSARGTVLGRMGEPDEVAAAVAFLASSDSSFITGASVVVDGGWSVRKEST